MSILITAGADAAAYRLEKTLQPRTVTIFADFSPLPSYPSDKRRFLQIPSGEDPSYAHILLALCLDHGITEIYPLRKSELVPLSESLQLFSEYGIDIFVPHKHLLDVFNDFANTKQGELFIVKNGIVSNVRPLRSFSFPDCSGIFLADSHSEKACIYTAD